MAALGDRSFNARSLDDRSMGWLRYLYRKTKTQDNWDRDGKPHDHWDETTGEPMTSWHRFDLIDSSYAIALMSDRTPAWREVYSEILDELVARHTSWWSASDWMTQFGDDPDRSSYPDHYRPLVPESHWGDYNVPGWTANGIDPYGVQADPIAADGMLFYKGFFSLLMGLHRYVSGDSKWDKPFEMIRDGANTFTWSRIFNEPNLDKFNEPTIEGVDFPKIALSEARWDGNTLHVAAHPQNSEVKGLVTTLKLVNIDSSRNWILTKPGGDKVSLVGKEGHIPFEITVDNQAVNLSPEN